MFRSFIIFLKSFPLPVIIWKLSCKIFGKKIPIFKKWSTEFAGKSGLEMGGPSGMFNSNGYFPIYPIIKKLDGVNFSDSTIWEGSIVEGFNYKYYTKTGYQFIAEGSKLTKISDDWYDFVLSCNNLEHMANPIQAVFEWKRVLKKKGVMLLILPNKEANFDHRRPYTKLEHIVADFENNIDEKDTTHLKEILDLHDLKRDPQAGSNKQFRTRCNDNFDNRCMHHHVFNPELLKGMIEYCGLKILGQYSSYTDHFVLAIKN